MDLSIKQERMINIMGQYERETQEVIENKTIVSNKHQLDYIISTTVRGIINEHQVTDMHVRRGLLQMVLDDINNKFDIRLDTVSVDREINGHYKPCQEPIDEYMCNKVLVLLTWTSPSATL